MVADGREKIADFIRFIIEKATLEKWVQSGSRGGGGHGLVRLVQDFIGWILKECVHISLGTFECGHLTRGIR